MARKNFKTSFGSLLDSDSSKVREKATVKEIRATFIVKESNLEKLKAIAYWERKTIKNVLDEALNSYTENYELERGPIKLPNNT